MRMLVKLVLLIGLTLWGIWWLFRHPHLIGVVLFGGVMTLFGGAFVIGFCYGIVHAALVSLGVL